MNRKSLRVSMFLLLALLVILIALPSAAMANMTYFGKIPATGYVKDCSLCHTSAPTLNDFGKKFKAAGFDFSKLTTSTTTTTTTKPATTTTTTTKPATTTTTTKPATTTVVSPKGVSEAEFVKMLNAAYKHGFTWTDNPAGNTTRDRAAMLMIRMLGITDSAESMTNSQIKNAVAIFKDADKIANPQYVALSAKYSLLKGFSDGTYRPNDLLTASQAKILVDRSGSFKGNQRTALWTQSAHNYELRDDYPGTRDNCAACHDGVGFAKELTKRADIGTDLNVIGCTTCHSDRAEGIKEAGVATTPNGKVTGGAGALCMTCHNSRKDTSTLSVENPGAPHRGPQSDVLAGIGGMEVTGVTYPSSPHAANPDTCVSCHGYKTEAGVTNHIFRVEDPSRACGSCHKGLETVNRTALGDFDGDGTTEGIQDEVAGLLHTLEGAINTAIDPDGGHLAESHGAFQFNNAAGEEVEVSEAVYRAAYNLSLIEQDGSHGVHNPAYVLKLLQQSYKSITGNDVPNATLR